MNKYQEALDRLNQDSRYQIGNEKMILQELVDRATPKKPIKLFKTYWHLGVLYENVERDCCPTCKENLIENKCCSNNDCRQAIDWSKDE